MKDHKKLPISKVAVYMVIGQALIVMIAMLVTSYIFFRRTVTELYEEMNRSITGAVLTAVDESVLGGIAKQANDVARSFDDPKHEYETNPEEYLSRFDFIMETDEYKEMQQRMNEIRRRTSSTCVMLTVLIPEKNIGIYVLDASDVNVMHCGVVYDYDGTDFVNNWGKEFKSYISESTTYGLLRTDGVACCSVEEGVYSYLVADIPLSRVAERTKHYLFQVGFVVLLIVIVMCIGTVMTLKKLAIRPLREITETAKSFTERYGTEAGETHVFKGIDPGDVTELQDLTKSLQSMEEEMNAYIESLGTLTAEKARISTELELAESIQANMLPNIFPAFPERSEFDIYALMDPAREVGGDFYDFFLIDEDHLAMVIADVSGKGIPAALFMMMSKILVKNFTMQGLQPAEILEKVNNAICQNNPNDMFVTIWIGILTISTGKTVCASAGHEYPILRKDGGQFEVVKDPHGIAAGTMGGMKYKNYDLQLNTGDTLFVYTDGLPEATNRSNELFGLERAVNVLNNEPDAEVEELFVEMGIAVAEFVEDAPQFDDLTMLAVKIKDIPLKADAGSENA